MTGFRKGGYVCTYEQWQPGHLPSGIELFFLETYGNPFDTEFNSHHLLSHAVEAALIRANTSTRAAISTDFGGGPPTFRVERSEKHDDGLLDSTPGIYCDDWHRDHYPFRRMKYVAAAMVSLEDSEASFSRDSRCKTGAHVIDGDLVGCPARLAREHGLCALGNYGHHTMSR
ncbi:hypothetical protein JHW43_001639 [Diplocarpon mali]|nr:hypothetical protein JHW43_001639 [Diplocarpon mali]